MSESVSSTDRSDSDRSSTGSAQGPSASQQAENSDAGRSTEAGMRGEAARTALSEKAGGVLADSATRVGATPHPDAQSDIVTDTAQTVGKAGVGYRADMYGEIGVGNRSVDIAGKRQFGGPVRDTTLADATYTARQGSGGAPYFGIDDFARTDRRGDFARNGIISSHAAVADSHATLAGRPDLTPEDIRFEVNRPGTTRARVDDATLPNALPNREPQIREYKAGASVPSGQHAQDIRSASGPNGRQIEVVVTNNPNTGSTGLSAAEQAKMARATQQTNGNLTTRYAPDIAPSRAAVETLEAASRISSTARVFGKVAAPVAIAADVYAIGSAYHADGNQIGINTKVAVAETAGGWAGAGAGAVGGAKAGAAIGTVIGGPIGTAVGAVAGGLIGAVGGAVVGSGLLGSLTRGWFS